MTTGEKIKTLRKGKNLTQKKVAEQTEINLRTWQSYEEDRARPPIETAVKIADYFKVDLLYLLIQQNLPKTDDGIKDLLWRGYATANENTQKNVLKLLDIYDL